MNTYRQTRPHKWPCKGYYTIEITLEEWETNGIATAGYYKYNKRAKGYSGVLLWVWLDRRDIESINEYFSKHPHIEKE